ncbi:MAG TPA: hypothetical protein VFB72_01725 [Verrucomicrobiae bacterium]|nr:hypothetical protein [Verrucomicrobiae bacterium]
MGHVITAAECGARRISHYTCPAKCSYLPFSPANYSQVLELEKKLDDQCMQFLMGTAPERAAKERELKKACFGHNPHAMHAWFVWNLFFARDAQGRTCAQQMEQSAAGLKNDDLVLLRAKQQTRVALLEIHRIVDAERIEAVDLLAPEAPVLRLQDRSLAASGVRFSAALGWVYPLPHYWRLSGSAIVIPELALFEPHEIVKEIVAHLRGPLEERELRLWLAEHFVRFSDALNAVSSARRLAMFADMDAKFGKVVYELAAPFGKCRDRLDEVFEIEPDELSAGEAAEGFAEARIWFGEESTTESKLLTPEGARPIIGRVMLGQAHWRLETFGGEKLAMLRRKFEKQMEGLVRFSGERLDDMAAAMAEKEPKFDKSLVPPSLLQNPQKIQISSSVLPGPPAGISAGQTEAKWRHAADRAFLEEHVPALDGRTPREAALDPALRPKLIRLLKERVRLTDEHNLKTGDNQDINWMLRELGTHEIIFDPPPPGRPPLDSDAEEDDDDFFDQFPVVDPSLPPAPPLPSEPLSQEVVAHRIAEIFEEYESAADAEYELAAAGLTLLEHASQLSADDLDDVEFGAANSLLTQAAMVLVPRGHRAPQTDYEVLESAYKRNVEALKVAVRHSSEALRGFVDESPQPALLQILFGELVELSMTGPEKTRPSIAAQAAILALVKSAVEVLDAALRD